MGEANGCAFHARLQGTTVQKTDASRFNFRRVIVKYRLLARLLYWLLRTVCGAGLLISSLRKPR